MAKIYLDPGHGGSDPGAVANGLKEKDLVLSIAKYARNYLQNNYKGVTVRMSCSTDKYLTLTQRANDANSWCADVFVSIHINAGGGVGYEDYIYDGKVSSNTHKLQDAIHKKVAPLFTRDRGQKRANFAVVRQTKMPAVLTENGYIDNKTDANFLSRKSNLKKIGEAHAKGIAVYLGLEKGSSKPKKNSSSKKKTSSKSKKSISQMASEVIAGKHGSGHENRRKSLGISKSDYEKVRAEVNKRAGSKSKATKVTKKKYPLPNGVYSRRAHGNKSLNAVKQIQRALNAANFKCGSVDGYYGAKTEDAVRRFQKVHDAYNVDGIYGKRTKTRLNKVVN